MLRAVRQFFITVGVIAVLLVGVGVGYTWYMGQNTQPAQVLTEESSDPVMRRAVATPIEPAENTPVGVYIQQPAITASVGQQVSLDARTRPRAACSVEIKYSETKKDTLGLEPVTADEYGIASWKWVLSDTTPAGTWPVSVTCAYGELSGVMTVKLTVK